MTYRVEFGPDARKELASLHPKARAAVMAELECLAQDPRPRGAVPLRGRLSGLHRIRIGERRVAYHIDDSDRVVTVVAVDSRGGFYEGLTRDKTR